MFIPRNTFRALSKCKSVSNNTWNMSPAFFSPLGVAPKMSFLFLLFQLLFLCACWKLKEILRPVSNFHKVMWICACTWKRPGVPNSPVHARATGSSRALPWHMEGEEGILCTQSHWALMPLQIRSFTTSHLLSINKYLGEYLAKWIEIISPSFPQRSAYAISFLRKLNSSIVFSV